ncbi:MAG: 50S ribosomal protein L25 [Candidatus Liptonbacteria bacterium]|nr:50S ribosomal protein L25 [Candidatus Liptonbacteria bacterium]
MELTVQTREKLGKASQTLRKEGLIPAEVYGHGFKNEHISVKVRDFLKVFGEAGENTVVSLKMGNEGWPVLIYDVHKDYLSGEVIHVDFYRVTMTEKIKAKIPLGFIGEAPAVREKLGILNKAMSEIEVEALPGDLPHRIEVNLSGLDSLDKSIYARGLKIPSGVKLLVDPETVVVTVVPMQKEEEVVAAPTEVDVTAVKVEGEEKKAEQEAQKTEEKDKKEKKETK